MPKVLAMELVSNAEVLTFIKEKKREHEEHAAEDKRNKRKPLPRPPELLRTLDQHLEHLESDHYPYQRNPSVYGNAGMIKVDPTHGDPSETSDMAAERRFNQLFAEKITYPAVKAKLAAKKTSLGRTLSPAEKQAIVNEVDAQRALSEAERLMIVNHAPTCLEMLQPMIENIEARYSADEQAFLVEAIQEVFRSDELKAAAEEPTNGAEADETMEADS